METNSSSSSRTSSPKDITKLSFWELFERSEKKEQKLRNKNDKQSSEQDKPNISSSCSTNSIPSFAQKLSDFTTQHLPYCISSKFTKIVSPIVNNENLFTEVFMPDARCSVANKEENSKNMEGGVVRTNIATTNLITKLKTREGSKKYQKYLQKHPIKAVKIFDIIKKDMHEFGINEPAKSFFLQLYSILPLAQKQETWNIFADHISFKCPDNSSSIVLAVLDKKEGKIDEEMILSAFCMKFSNLAYCKNGINFLLKILSSFNLITIKPLIHFIRLNFMQLLYENESAVLSKKIITLMKDYEDSEKEELINLLLENPNKSVTEKQTSNCLILIMSEWGINKVEKFITFVEADLIQYVDNEHSNKFIKCLIERNEKVLPKI